MKLSLDQLCIDSYACQMSEAELTLIRGGEGEEAITPLIIGGLALLAIGGCVNTSNQNSQSGNNTTTQTVAPHTTLDSVSVTATVPIKKT